MHHDEVLSCRACVSTLETKDPEAVAPTGSRHVLFFFFFFLYPFHHLNRPVNQRRLGDAESSLSLSFLHPLPGGCRAALGLSTFALGRLARSQQRVTELEREAKKAMGGGASGVVDWCGRCTTEHTEGAEAVAGCWGAPK